MKTRLYLFVFLIPLFFSCKKQSTYTFENPLDSPRKDEVIVFERSAIADYLEFEEGTLPVFKLPNGDYVPTQVDDLDGDGKWDEAVLVIDFKPGEKLVLEIDFMTEETYPEFEKRTNLRLGIEQDDGSFMEVDEYEALPCDDGFEIIAQGESVNWENDKIGFRNYFDCRNVKDLFGKRKPEMIIDKIHTPELGDYHKLADWGMDVLHCGSSLGSGGLALLKEDSLYRLGSTDVYSYHKVVEGPLRSVFDLRYEGWDVDGDMLEAVERISIYPGKYWFKSEVTVLGCPEGSQIVTGIVTSHLKREPFQFQANDFQCIGTHDVQSLNNDELGMAVVVPQDEAGKIGRTTDINFFKLGYETVPEKGFSNIISETYYIGQHCESGQPASHYFFAVWGLDKDQWKTEEGFRRYIEEETEKLSSGISVIYEYKYVPGF